MNFDMSKFSQGLSQLGSSLLQTGMGYAIMKDNMHGGGCGGSIFGGGMGGGFGMNPMMMGGMNPMMGGMDPMMMGGGFDMMGGGMSDPYGGGYGIGYAQGSGYAMGVQARARINAEKLATGEMKTSNTKASTVSKKQDTSQGQAFEKDSQSMINEEGSPVKGKVFQFMSDAWTKSSNNKKADAKEAKEYKEGISNFGKSYLMEMDKASGNGNGELDIDEFVAHQMKDLPENADSDKKAKAKSMAQALFFKLDQNGDKIVDWKENSSMMMALDKGNTDGGIDGKIKSEDFANISKLAGSGAPNELDQMLRQGYTDLFGNEKK